jgi:hypothetical protein
MWSRESSDEGRESRAGGGVELRVEGVLGAGRWSLDARHHLALRSQGFGEAGCATEVCPHLELPTQAVEII